MDGGKSQPARECLDDFCRYAAEASTRKGLYGRMLTENGVKKAALCMAAKRAGAVSPTHSLKFTFSEEQEEALAVVCLLHARQGTALRIRDFIELASFLAGKKDGHKFSYRFVHEFVSRHSASICIKSAVITSPKRSLETMKSKTLDFIRALKTTHGHENHQQKQYRSFR